MLGTCFLGAEDLGFSAPESPSIEFSALDPIATIYLQNGNRLEFYEPYSGFLVLSEDGHQFSKSIRDQIDFATDTPYDVLEILSRGAAPEGLRELYRRFSDAGMLAEGSHEGPATPIDLFMDLASDPSIDPASTERILDMSLSEENHVHKEYDMNSSIGASLIEDLSSYSRSYYRMYDDYYPTVMKHKYGNHDDLEKGVRSFNRFVYSSREDMSFKTFYRFGPEWTPVELNDVVKPGRYRWTWMYHQDYTFDALVQIADQDAAGYIVGSMDAPSNPVRFEPESPELDTGVGETVHALGLPPDECYQPGEICPWFDGTRPKHWDVGYAYVDGVRENGVTVETLSQICHSGPGPGPPSNRSIGTDDCADDLGEWPKKWETTETYRNIAKTRKNGYYRTCNGTNNACHEYATKRFAVLHGYRYGFTKDPIPDTQRTACHKPVEFDIHVRNYDLGYVYIDGHPAKNVNIRIRNYICNFKSGCSWTPPEYGKTNHKGYYLVRTRNKIIENEWVVASEREIHHKGVWRGYRFSARNSGRWHQEHDLSLTSPLPNGNCPRGTKRCEPGRCVPDGLDCY